MNIYKDKKVHITYLCVLFLLFFSLTSQAHPMLQSQVEAKAVDDFWVLTLKLPNNRLAAALKKPVTETLLTNYVLAHISVTSPENSLLWQKEVTHILKPDDHKYWQIEVKLIPPKGVDISVINIDYQVILEKIITHKVIFWLMPNDTHKMKNIKPKRLSTLRGNKHNIVIKSWE